MPQARVEDTDAALADTLRQAGVADAVIEHLAAWQHGEGIRIVFDRWLSPGRSKAVLAAVALTGPVFNGKLIMKVCPAGPATGREPDRHKAALDDAPEFAGRHLVRQPVGPVIVPGGTKVMFQEIAGGSLRDVRPLSVVRGRSVPGVVRAVTQSVLDDWNPQPSVIKRMSAKDFFIGHLGTRLAAAGPVDQLADQLTYEHDGDDVPLWVRFAEHNVVANAVAWAGLDTWDIPGEDHVLTICGRAHGDLHADNILLPMNPRLDAGAYRLIDLSDYAGDAPLTRDLAHLALALIVGSLPELTDGQRGALADLLIDPAADAGAELVVPALADVASAIAEAGEAYGRALAMLEDWQEQYLLSLAGNALLFAMRAGTVTLRDRGWCYQLACRALGRFFTVRGLHPPAGPAPRCHLVDAAESGPTAAAVADRLVEVCDRWTSRRTTIAIVDSATLSSDARRKFAGLGWNLVIELNPDTGVDGGWSAALAAGGTRIHRLLQPGQDMMFGLNSTTWIAAAGLRDGTPLPPQADLRGWRAAYLPFVQEALRALGRHSGRPVSVVCFGRSRGGERALVEACLDVFVDRMKVVSVSGIGTGDVEEYDPELLACEPVEVLQALPDLAPAAEAGRRALVPGADGPVEVADELLSRFADIAVLLHSEMGVESEPGQFEMGAFYRGRPISWFELDLNLDLPRPFTGQFVDDLRAALQQRDTLRVTLSHTPGAGGTTVARRVAWDLKDEFPTVLARGSQDVAVLAQLIYDLQAAAGLPVLLVLELFAESAQEHLYELLRADSVPMVMLITTRRVSVAGRGRSRADRQPNARLAPQRSLAIGAMKRDEQLEMARHFAALVPPQEDELYRMVSQDAGQQVPFLFALTAFDEDFEGLPDYVTQYLDGIGDVDRKIVIMLALAHRFSGVPVPAEVFTNLLGVAPSDNVELLHHVDAKLAGLLIEDGDDMWRLPHSLIAQEVLRQLLTSAGAAAGPEDWKAGVPGWCARLIAHAAAVYRQRLPEDLKTLFDRLFILRGNGDLDADQRSGTYTELLELMTVPGRKEVMHRLVEGFPNEAHFWGHYGRLLSYDSRDFAGALRAVDRAITLSPRDPSLHHIRGMVFRNEIRSLAEDRSANADASARERRILELADSAQKAFETVSELDDSSEYGHISVAQMCIGLIEFGFRQARASTYAQFLSRPDAGAYRALLETAEASLDAVAEIRGSSHPSLRVEETEADLHKLYDNYQALLQGWRNLLDRPGTFKPPVRRRLARAYRQRSGSWSSARPSDLRQAVELLEANLLDDPRDFVSLREWLQAARFVPVSLSRAADYVTTWARAEPSRDALFYDYVLACLRVFDGQDSAIDEYRQKLARCQARAAGFGNRHSTMYEWLRDGAELGRLVSYRDLRDWERRDGQTPPPYLTRRTGHVRQIKSQASGTIDFGRGVEAFTVPSRAGLVRGQHENWTVTALVAFRYDGPMAWDVALQRP